MKCYHCARFGMRDAGKMAKYNFGNCAAKEQYEFVSATFERNCDKFAKADDERIKLREIYLNKEK